MKEFSVIQSHLKKFPFYLRRSTYIHLALFVISITAGKIIFFQQQKQLNANIELIKSSVRVDMVAMPKHTLNELKNFSSGEIEAKKEEISAVASPEEKTQEHLVAPNPKMADSSSTFEEVNKQKRQNFLSKLKKIGNKKINSNGDQKVEKGLHGEKISELKDLVLAGNKLNVGTALQGEGNEEEMTAYQVYASRLPDLVRPHWRLPSFLLAKKLKARIRVWLAMNGEVTRADVYQTSGDDEYDKHAIDAVKGASPFPRLSEDIAKRGINGNIILGFPL